MWNLFKVNNKDTRTTSLTSFRCLLLTLNSFHTLFWSFNCWLWTSKYRLGCNYSISFLRLYCTKKWSFPLMTSSVNVTKSTVSCRFGHIYSRSPQWKIIFLCSASAMKIFVRNTLKGLRNLYEMGHVHKKML